MPLFLLMSMSLTNIAILNIKGADYPCITSGIDKREVINLTLISTWLKKEEYYKT